MKKGILSFLLFLFACALLCLCSNMSCKQEKETVGLFPVKIGGRYGYIDRSGKYVWESTE